MTSLEASDQPNWKLLKHRIRAIPGGQSAVANELGIHVTRLSKILNGWLPARPIERRRIIECVREIEASNQDLDFFLDK